MALTGRVCEPRSARQRSTPACLPPLQNCRKSLQERRQQAESPPPPPGKPRHRASERRGSAELDDTG
eukprot:6668167-Prymnesium_polylepis.1